ncbi:MAG TPA: D-glycerate dehydrogenase [Bacillales bacterium]|nr:D-glycerate dehydrogenase [Bacillales bacterium]
MNSILVYNKIPDFLLEKLEQHCKVSYFEEITDGNQDEFEHELSNTNALLGAGLPITKDLFERAPHLRYVGNISAGYDNFDIEKMTEKHVMAVNAPNALVNTTADLIFGLLLSTGRRITELDRYVRNKQWTEAIGNARFGIDVHHKTIGIIGMGRIGQAVAKRAALGFSMKVLYHKRNRDFEAEKSLGATYCELKELLQESDYVCLTLPLTDKTYHLIDEKELLQMKSTAILINGGRGPLVNETSLVKALEKGTITAAGLDVFEEEPLAFDSPLMAMDNVVLTPHIGSATKETRTGMAEEAVENLLQALKGTRPNNLLNPEVLVK